MRFLLICLSLSGSYVMCLNSMELPAKLVNYVVSKFKRKRTEDKPSNICYLKCLPQEIGAVIALECRIHDFREHVRIKSENYYCNGNQLFKKKYNITWDDPIIFASEKRANDRYYNVPIITSFSINRNKIIALQKMYAEAYDQDTINCLKFLIGSIDIKNKLISQPDQTIYLESAYSSTEFARLYQIKTFTVSADGNTIASIEGMPKKINLIMRRKENGRWISEIIEKYGDIDVSRFSAIELFEEFNYIALLKNNDDVQLLQIPDSLAFPKPLSIITSYLRNMRVCKELKNSK